MEKYLFADGTSEVREVQSDEELSTLIQSSKRPDLIRIWVFNTHEWISYQDFNKQKGVLNLKSNPLPEPARPLTRKPSAGRKLLKKVFIFLLAGATLFLVYNFTRLTWKKTTPLSFTAARPSNVPLLDADSLFQNFELVRGQKLDKTTKTNLRIRNDWPDRIILQLNASRDTSSAGSKYYDIELTIDNTTGYMIDNAVVKLTSWKGNNVGNTDTVRFNNISYAMAAKRTVHSTYRGDSLSVSFETIRARSFNFCYSAGKKSNYGNASDRWFCRE